MDVSDEAARRAPALPLSGQASGPRACAGFGVVGYL